MNFVVPHDEDDLDALSAVRKVFPEARYADPSEVHAITILSQLVDERRKHVTVVCCHGQIHITDVVHNKEVDLAPTGKVLEPYGERCAPFARMFSTRETLRLRTTKRRSALGKEFLKNLNSSSNKIFNHLCIVCNLPLSRRSSTSSIYLSVGVIPTYIVGLPPRKKRRIK